MHISSSDARPGPAPKPRDHSELLRPIEEQDDAQELVASIFILKDGERVVFDKDRELRIILVKLHGSASAVRLRCAGYVLLEYSGSTTKILCAAGVPFPSNEPGVRLLPGAVVEIEIASTDPAKPAFLEIQMAAEPEPDA